MTELEKLVQTWGKFKPTGTPHEHIWNGFIEDAIASIEREKQALSLGAVSDRRELLIDYSRFVCSSLDVDIIGEIEVDDYLKSINSH